MERLDDRFKDARRALQTLFEIQTLATTQYSDVIIRDAAIQRFEYTFEAFWKFIKEYLKVREKLERTTPASCFRELLILSLADENETTKLLEMTDDRNMTAHTYKEEVANFIYGRLKEYSLLMEKVLDRIAA